MLSDVLMDCGCIRDPGDRLHCSVHGTNRQALVQPWMVVWFTACLGIGMAIAYLAP